MSIYRKYIRVEYGVRIDSIMYAPSILHGLCRTFCAWRFSYLAPMYIIHLICLTALGATEVFEGSMNELIGFYTTMDDMDRI